MAHGVMHGGVAAGGADAPAGMAPMRLVLLDWRHDPFQATEGKVGAGVIRVELDPVPIGQIMVVERIAVSSNSTTDTNVTAYVGDPGADANHVDFSGAGNRDIADEYQPILVPGGERFFVEWDQASAGAIGIARIQYALYKVGR